MVATCCYCGITSVTYSGMVCASNCQKENNRDCYGMPMLDNGKRDMDLWETWLHSKDEGIRRKVELIEDTKSRISASIGIDLIKYDRKLCKSVSN